MKIRRESSKVRVLGSHRRMGRDNGQHAAVGTGRQGLRCTP